MPGLTATTLLFIVIGLAGGSYGLLMAHARAFVPAHLTGRGVTLMNFFSIGGVGADAVRDRRRGDGLVRAGRAGYRATWRCSPSTR